MINGRHNRSKVKLQMINKYIQFRWRLSLQLMEPSKSGASLEDAINHSVFIKTLHSQVMDSISCTFRFSPPRVEVSMYKNYFHMRFCTNKFVWCAKSQTDSHLLRSSFNHPVPHNAILLADCSKSFHLPNRGRVGRKAANKVNCETKT